MTGFSNDDSLPEGVERIRAENAGLLTLSGTNTYLVGRPAWVIDPGPDDSAHLERIGHAAEKRGGIAGIALTHSHIDHAGGAASLRERSGAPLGAKAPAREMIEGIFREPQVEGLILDVELGEGDSFGPLQVFETPGHAIDHLSFLWNGTLFVGDTVLGEGSVFIPPEPHALRNYLDSLRRLQKLELSALCPGHGPVVHDPRAKLAEYIEHRLDRERRLRQALESGLRSRDDLLDYAWSDVPAGLRPAAALTLEAHLQKLAEEGDLPEGVSPAS